MKKNILFITAAMLVLVCGCSQDLPVDTLQKNKDVSVIYHKLQAADIDAILTEDYQGRNELGRHTWDREDHRQWLSGGVYVKDSILQQVAEGDWVATRFVRTIEWKGDTVTGEVMHFKRFVNGKIAEIWEYSDSRQFDPGEK